MEDDEKEEEPEVLTIRAMIHVDIYPGEDPKMVEMEVIRRYQTHLEYSSISDRGDWITEDLTTP